jgi:streptomycin 6-kinase
MKPHCSLQQASKAIRDEDMDIPEVVRNKAAVVGALDWVRRLPGLIGDLEAEWSFRVTRPLKGATEAYVAEADLAGGGKAVLKLLIPRDSMAVANEIEVLRVVEGDGCPLLYRADPHRGAILMERLGPSLETMGMPIERRHQILCEAARRIWRPVDLDLPSGAEKAGQLIDFILEKWETLGRPLPNAVIDHAVRCARSRIEAHDPARSMLVHGDVHQWNALSDGDGFKLIDPDGLVAEPEYDLGIIMREDPIELTMSNPYERAASLASLTGLDPEAIWEWGIVERVSTGLLLTEIDLQPVGGQMLAAAEYVTRSS